MAAKTQIILGVCGGIAAYKICDLASHLTQDNCDVHVVMTQSATRFIAPLTFQALTQNPVHTSLWPDNGSSESGVAAAMAHIDLATRADVILIAPASANFIVKLAGGVADDLLSTLVLATRAKVLIAPAMNPTMYQHPATQRNLQTLRAFGYEIIEPESGRMACEHVGAGRLPATGVLRAHLQNILQVRAKDQTLASKKVLVTAGPTRENIDPVRFLSNRSSGKMGYALAEEAASRGAEVFLVSGPTQLSTPCGVTRIDVISTQEMFDAVKRHTPNCDIIIAAAAPADFAPVEISDQKIKKQSASGVLQLQLAPTPDIIAHAAKMKKPHQLFIGFAAETNSEISQAQRKLESKNLDAIVFNDVTQEGAGFDIDTNRVTWISKTETEAWPLQSKREVASQIWDRVAKLTESEPGA